jgi:hypothetical protein
LEDLVRENVYEDFYGHLVHFVVIWFGIFFAFCCVVARKNLANLQSQQAFTYAYLEVRLVSLEHSIEPFEQLLGAVVGVQDDRDAIVLGHEAHVLSSGDRALGSI